MKKYEITFIADEHIDEDTVKRANETLQKFINDNGGSVFETDEWGKQRLAYPIDKKKQGVYFRLRFEAEENGIKQLDDYCKMDETIIRHLITVITKAEQKSMEARKIKAEDEKAEKEKAEEEKSEEKESDSAE